MLDRVVSKMTNNHMCTHCRFSLEGVICSYVFLNRIKKRPLIMYFLIRKQQLFLSKRVEIN